MALLPPRTLATEVQKHFRTTGGDGAIIALRLGQEVLDLFVAAHPGTTPEQARAILHRNKNRGRRPSRAAET